MVKVRKQIFSVMKRRWLLGSTAESNDSLRLELPGAREPPVSSSVGELVQRWDPKIVFLSETKIRKKVMEKVMEKINFVNGLIVPRRGRRGFSFVVEERN